ncbi:MAG: AMP-binding protein, partial [Myxococcales bacterium]|nr:AMP-binding protein [Myxococcales bacterium]
MTDDEMWSLGDLIEGVEAVLPPDAPALVHDDEVVSWNALARASRSLAAAFAARGAKPGDKVAFYMRNQPAYMLALAACFKGAYVHVNVNYRYLDDELLYILDDSDAAVVVYAAEFDERIARVRERAGKVRAWVRVGPGEPPAFAESFAALAGERPDAALDVARSADDLLFIYTGGTTGMPKGVMWRHGDLWGALGYGANARANRGARPATPAEHVANVKAHGVGPRQYTACPLMHGTGLLTAIGNFVGGGVTLTTGGERFEAEAALDFVDRARAESMVIVGDAFARPIVD